MARTEGQWNKGISYITPNDDVPVLLRNTYLNFGGSIIGASGYGFRDNSGVMEVKNSAGSWAPVGIAGGSAHVIQEEGASLSARSKLNFLGKGVTAVDNAGADSTDVTVLYNLVVSLTAPTTPVVNDLWVDKN